MLKPAAVRKREPQPREQPGRLPKVVERDVEDETQIWQKSPARQAAGSTRKENDVARALADSRHPVRVVRRLSARHLPVGSRRRAGGRARRDPPRGSGIRPPRARRRGVSDGHEMAIDRAPRLREKIRRVQRRGGRARHVQGSVAPATQPVRGDRGHAHRRARGRHNRRPRSDQGLLRAGAGQAAERARRDARRNGRVHREDHGGTRRVSVRRRKRRSSR